MLSGNRGDSMVGHLNTFYGGRGRLQSCSGKAAAVSRIKTQKIGKRVLWIPERNHLCEEWAGRLGQGDTEPQQLPQDLADLLTGVWRLEWLFTVVLL